jgi:hypothetical protein
MINLKDLFKGLENEQFKTKFQTSEVCLKTLADMKWEKGFVCSKCGGTNFCQGKTPYSRRCTKCKKEESATARTLFHHCRIDLPKAFEIAYLVCGSPKMPASEISHLLETRHMTCLQFKKRILQCIESEGKLVAWGD